MSLIEEYYELNESEEVSAVWKVLQIGFYACAACLGLWCGFTIAILRLRFDDRCYLFTEVKAPTSPDEKIDMSNLNWESDAWCDYYQFSMVSSFIVAVIWATFFLMCGKGGKSITGLPQPWRIVWSSLIFNFIYFLIILSTAVKIQQGTDVFCASQKIDKIVIYRNPSIDCKTLKFLLKKDLHFTAVQLEIVTKTSWGCAVSWIILFFLSLFRIVFVVDFHMYKICVFKVDDSIQNKKEEVLRITNYEEPKQISPGKDAGKRPYRSASQDNLDNFGNFETGKRKRTKVDKKSTRQTNAVFFVSADIRTLNREKRNNPSRVVGETFEKSKNILGPELRKYIKIQYAADDPETPEIPKFIYRCPGWLDGEEGENELDSSYPLHDSDLDDDSDRSDSNGDVLSDDFRPNTPPGLRRRI